MDCSTRENQRRCDTLKFHQPTTVTSSRNQIARSQTNQDRGAYKTPKSNPITKQVQHISVILLIVTSFLFLKTANCFRNKYGTFTVISAKPCQNAHGQVGTCMFMWDCIKTEGVHLGTCSDRFLFGSCCYHNATANDIDIQQASNNISSTSTTLATDIDTQKVSSKVFGSAASLSTVSNQESTLSSLLQPTYQPSQSIESSTLAFLQSSSSSLSSYSQAVPFNNVNQHDLNATTIAAGTQTAPIGDDSIKVQLDERPTSWQESDNSDFLLTRPTVSGASELSSMGSTTTSHLSNDTSKTSLEPISSTSSTNHDYTTSSSSSKPATPNQTQPSNGQTNEPSYSSSQHQLNSQNGGTVVSLSPAVRPNFQPGSWFNRPASAIASMFHSFKPFPYLNPTRPRPTYRPFFVGMAQRPGQLHVQQQQQRPIQAIQQRPNHGLISGLPLHQDGASSMDKFSPNSNNNNSDMSVTSLHNSSAPEQSPNQDTNSDQLASSSSFTDRNRPMNSLAGHSQSHYDLIGTNSSSFAPVAIVDKQQSQLLSPPTVAETTGGSMNKQNHSHLFQSDPYGLESASTSRPSSVVPDGGQMAETTVSIGNPFSVGYLKPEVSVLHAPQMVVNHSVYPPSMMPSYPIDQLQNNHVGSLDDIPGISISQPAANNGTFLPAVSNSIQQQQPGGGPYLTPDSVVSGPYFEPSAAVSTPTSTNYTSRPTFSTQPSFPDMTTASHASGDQDSIVTASLASSTPTNSVSQSPQTTMSPPSPPQAVSPSSSTSIAGREVTCGTTSLYPRTKVVGGKNAAFGAWPWQVSVRKVSFFGFSSTHRCGGAVISSEWIATAGHCVEDLNPQSIRIRVGEYDFSSASEPYPYIERAVRRKVVHPKYNFYTYENDLALVQLDQPIQFPPHVSPICLPPDNIDLLGRNATVTGWGRLNEGGTLPTILQEVRVPIVSNDKCKDMFLRAGRPEYIPDIFLCAGYEEGGRDSCQGDSGGPLQVRGDDGKWFLAGIISWGIGCAEQNLPGVCTRISRFKLWIQSTMSSNA